ncbi:MAG: hypothetical protein J6Y67_04895 [Lachnospiraceae bacterium]|nr:hypothetical protein [Lachnospiraceae bacterium]
MGRKFLAAVGIVVLCAMVAGCGKKPTDNTTVTPRPREPLPKIEVFKPEHETSRTVTWMFDYFSGAFGGIKEETAKEINRILYERGLDCQIVFVNAGMVDETPALGEQMDIYEKDLSGTYGHLDIVCSGLGNGVDTKGKVAFLEERMIPLNDRINSADGQTLREFFTENEWKQAAYKGNIYVVPTSACYSGEDENYNDLYDAVGLGVFLSVREEYAEYFNGFDGTYDSLRKIYDTIGNSDLHIVLCGADKDVVYGLMGYSVLYDFPYREDTKTVVDITENDELAFLLMRLSSDKASGILVLEDGMQDMEGDVLAYIHRNVRLPREGYQEYFLGRYIDAFNVNCRYGISTASGQKDLAFEILSLCSTDPEILGLLYPGLQKETVVRRKELLSVLPKSDLSGILLLRTEKEYAALYDPTDEDRMSPDQAYTRLIGGMFARQGQSRWNIETEWETFKKCVARYSGVCETVNEEVRDWLNGK